MKVATELRKLTGFEGNAWLFKLSEPVDYDYNYNTKQYEKSTNYVVVSAVDVMFSGPETYIFPANEDGKVINWSELEGSFKGGLDHLKALGNAGYEVNEPMTAMTGIHDSATCTADNGQPCTACMRANEQEQRQQAVKNLAAAVERGLMIDRAIDATNAELKAYVSVLTLREALMDVIDEGCRTGRPSTKGNYRCVPWVLNDQDEDYANVQRMKFVDAVCARIAELHLPPHNAVRLENLCPRHRLARLPKPTASVCADCKREQGAAKEET